ncbi:MAG: LbtU family siderophore porin [Desulfurivibrionaceae bacterium]
MKIRGEILSSSLRGAVSRTAFLLTAAVAVAVMPAVSHAGEAELKAEIDKIWSKLANVEVAAGITEPAPVEPTWSDRLTIGGVVEVEAGVYDDDTFTESDIAVATVELGIEAEVSDFSSAHVLLLYEDDDDLQVDEAFITLGNLERNPFYLTAGKLYVPFGNYESQMVSDPLTLEIGEAREDALLVGIEVAGFYVSAYGFNGDTQDDGDDVVEHYGANLGYAFEAETVSFDIGGGWISSIRDSDGLSDILGAIVEDPLDPLSPFVETEYIQGYSAHLIAGLGPLTLIAEYLTAADDLLAANPFVTNSRISAYNVEAGVFFPLAGRDAYVAVGYQETDEALWAGLAEKRIVTAVAVEIMDGTSLALEWLNEEDYDGVDSDIYTLQLAAEF